jgi:hypothetical protein
MGKVEESVRPHPGDFAAFALSAAYLEHMSWRQAILGQVGAAPRGPGAAALLETIAIRDRTLVDKLEVDWDAGRFTDSPESSSPRSGSSPPTSCSSPCAGLPPSRPSSPPTGSVSAVCSPERPPGQGSQPPGTR